MDQVLQICKSAGIQWLKQTSCKYAGSVWRGLLSGTSPKVLPICSIDKKVYKTDHPLLIEIQNAYNKLIENYLREKDDSGSAIPKINCMNELYSPELLIRLPSIKSRISWQIHVLLCLAFEARIGLIYKAFLYLC